MRCRRLRDLHEQLRSHPGSDRPELPRQARHQARRRRRRARSRRPAVDHRPARLILGPDDEHPGAAQPVARRLSAADRRRTQRLGRRLAGHARSREPRGAVARSRGAGAPQRRDGQGAGEPAGRSIPPMSASPTIWLAPEVATQVRRMSDAEGLARDDDWAPGTPSRRRRPQVLLREVDPEIVAHRRSRDRRRAPGSSGDRSVCSPRATPTTTTSPRPPMRCARR